MAAQAPTARAGRGNRSRGTTAASPASTISPMGTKERRSMRLRSNRDPDRDQDGREPQPSGRSPPDREPVGAL